MRFLISPVGSHGDTLPFVGLGLALQRRGHEVILYGNGLYSALAHDAGLRYVETSDAQLAREAMARPEVTRSDTGLAIVAEGVMGTVLTTLAAMSRDVRPGQTIAVGSSLAFAPRLLAETQRLPFAAVHLSPSIYRSNHLAPRLTQLGHLERWPAFMKQGIWALMDRGFLDPLFTDPLNRIRAGLNLPPVQRVMHEWIHQGAINLALFPGWLAPAQPDWPATLQCVGFPLYDAAPDATLPPDLRAFLDDGAAPVVFTAGTANTSSQAFYTESLQASQRAGLRCVLVAKERSQLPAELPASALHVRYAPFSQLYARARVVVHHGGIGTLSQALYAGVPQLIQPMAYDQLDNASRACRLGVALELSPRAYKGARLDVALADLVSNAERRARCQALAAQMANENGIDAACAALLAIRVR